MAGFWDQIKNIFGKSVDVHEQQTPAAVHELINRPEEELKDYESWKNSKRKDQALRFMQMEYKKDVLSEENYLGSTFYTINKPASEGFILNFNEQIFSPLEFQHFFDYLKEKILALDYKLYSSDLRIFNRPRYVESIERHYMKPRYRFNDDKHFIQQYGNIMVTQIKKDHKPVYIQLMCNRYMDRKYTAPMPFKELITHLFDK